VLAWPVEDMPADANARLLLFLAGSDQYAYAGAFPVRRLLGPLTVLTYQKSVADVSIHPNEGLALDAQRHATTDEQRDCYGRSFRFVRIIRPSREGRRIVLQMRATWRRPDGNAPMQHFPACTHSRNGHPVEHVGILTDLHLGPALIGCIFAGCHYSPFSPVNANLHVAQLARAQGAARDLNSKPCVAEFPAVQLNSTAMCRRHIVSSAHSPRWQRKCKDTVRTYMW
jgi:hypothetical protein